MNRVEFTGKTKLAALDRSKGVCECHLIPRMIPCGLKLKGQPIFYEHIIQCEVGGDNSLENCAALTKTCWRSKTDTQDLPIIAKVKRVERKHNGIRKAPKMQGQGFRKASPQRTASRPLSKKPLQKITPLARIDR